MQAFVWAIPTWKSVQPSSVSTSPKRCLTRPQRHCNLIVSHHPLLFKGLREVTGRTATERIVMRAIRENVAIYSAHTNLDSPVRVSAIR